MDTYNGNIQPFLAPLIGIRISNKRGLYSIIKIPITGSIIRIKEGINLMEFYKLDFNRIPKERILNKYNYNTYR